MEVEREQQGKDCGSRERTTGRRTVEAERATGRRTVEAERNQLGWKSWKMAENVARDRTEWRKLLSAPTRDK